MKGGALSQRLEQAGFLLRPVFLMSLACLVLNDQVLKAWWPGPVTGKISDFCGLAVLAMLTWAVIVVVVANDLRTERIDAVVITIVCSTIGCSFAMMKIWTPAEEVYKWLNSVLATPAVNLSAWLHGDFTAVMATTNIVHDRTDLLAVPILIPVGIYLFRCARGVTKAAA